ncbi:MAG: hypothetical protein ACYTFG_19765 [Planctomycetota bacterium]|jgi:hypothetical protein
MERDLDRLEAEARAMRQAASELEEELRRKKIRAKLEAPYPDEALKDFVAGEGLEVTGHRSMLTGMMEVACDDYSVMVNQDMFKRHGFMEAIEWLNIALSGFATPLNVYIAPPLEEPSTPTSSDEHYLEMVERIADELPDAPYAKFAKLTALKVRRGTDEARRAAWDEAERLGIGEGAPFPWAHLIQDCPECGPWGKTQFHDRFGWGPGLGFSRCPICRGHGTYLPEVLEEVLEEFVRVFVNGVEQAIGETMEEAGLEETDPPAGILAVEGGELSNEDTRRLRDAYEGALHDDTVGALRSQTARARMEHDLQDATDLLQGLLRQVDGDHARLVVSSSRNGRFFVARVFWNEDRIQTVNRILPIEHGRWDRLNQCIHRAGWGIADAHYNVVGQRIYDVRRDDVSRS